MNLIIDLGNTQIKYFVFENDTVKGYYAVLIDTWKNTLKKIKNKYPSIKNCIISDEHNMIGKGARAFFKSFVMVPFTSEIIQFFIDGYLFLIFFKVFFHNKRFEKSPGTLTNHIMFISP